MDNGVDHYTQVFISQKNDQLPANDLVVPTYDSQGQVVGKTLLDPQQAITLKSQGTDLSLLEPDDTKDFWKGVRSEGDFAEDQALPIQDGDTVHFLSALTSSSGRFRFNVEVQSPDGSIRTMTLMLSETLHTTLLRKELLRRLGYKIPAVKYLKKVRVRFDDVTVKDPAYRDKDGNIQPIPLIREVLNEQLFHAAGGATRWCSASAQVLEKIPGLQCVKSDDAGDGALEVVLQDLVAMDARTVYYNVAMAVPSPNQVASNPEQSRVLRALAVPYGLLDVPESINQLDWYVGAVQNESVTFNVPDETNFSCTLDDARWILKKLSSLTREDFKQVVANAAFPELVGKVVVEKLISRRNSLMNVFGMKEAALAFDSKVSGPGGDHDPILRKGKLLQKKWDGYASQFASTDAPSPLQGLKWYLLSEAHSNAMSNLLQMANEKLPALTTAEAYQKHQRELQEQLTQFMKNGLSQKIGVGVWVAPVANGNVTISRDVVIGNYLGTNKLVQLADTFGFGGSIGLTVGFDNLPTMTSISAGAQATASISFTHLKPLTNLKQSVTEPMKNEFVPWIMKNASGIFQKVHDLPVEQAKPMDPTQLQKSLNDELNELDKFLGVGESLILTESLNGAANIAGAVQAPIPISPSVSLQLGANGIVLSRLYFYRKSPTLIQVFKDNGELAGINISFTATTGAIARFPILNLSAKGVTGTAKTRYFNVNIDPHPSTNPRIYDIANGLAVALKSGSVDVLSSIVSPALVSVRFKDSSSSLQFFHWVHRTLKTNGKYFVQLPDGTHGTFLSLTDGKQSGAHYQQLATEAATYLVQYLTKSGSFSLDTQASTNPGQSFLGHSETRDTNFQSRFDSDLTDSYFRVNYRWQGWSMAPRDMLSLVQKLGDKYGFTLYDSGFLGDTKSIKLYQLSLYVNIYETGIKHVLAMSSDQEKAIEKKYRSQSRCDLYMGSIDQMTGEEISRCAAINRFQDAFYNLRKDQKKPGKRAPDRRGKDIMKLLSSAEQFTGFKELVDLIGGDQNVYVSAMLTGYRTGQESKSDELDSNTFGHSPAVNTNGPVDGVQQTILGIDDGEFKMQWLRDVL
jgi:hypothetical protein